METINLSAFFQKIENAEIDAWQDLLAAAPLHFRQEKKLSVRQIHGITLVTCETIAFREFNRALDLGINEPCTEQMLLDVLAEFRNTGIKGFYIHQSPASKPSNLSNILESNGLRIISGWDRIFRHGHPLSKMTVSNRYTVEKVTNETAREWANFIDTTYHFPTTDWLLCLVERDHWYNYICRENGQIVAARSMKINANGTAYLPIDAPVPGVMTQVFEPDFFIVQQMVKDGLALGVTLFATDIEKPSPSKDTPAYHFFGDLDFEVAYFRNNYAL